MNKRFNTEKNGYCISEVDSFILESNKTISQLKEVADQLNKQLSEKEVELKSFKQKQDLIVKSIMSAVQKADQIEHLIQQKYKGEMEHLAAFHQQWTSYYKNLIQEYPLSDQLNSLAVFNKKMDDIITGNQPSSKKFAAARDQFEKENQRLKKKYVGFIPVSGDYDSSKQPSFNPEDNIRQLLRRKVAEEEKTSGKTNDKNGSTAATDSIAATLPSSENSKDANSSCGFSFEEALRPTQQLSEILQEIGISLEENQQDE